jgi:hypothetical protein
MKQNGCPECEKSTGPCNLHSSVTYILGGNTQPLPQMGWLCPRCGAGVSPLAIKCPCSMQSAPYWPFIGHISFPYPNVYIGDPQPEPFTGDQPMGPFTTISSYS